MSLHNTRRNSYGWLLLSAALGASTAEAAIDISSAPLETGTAVPPNILFILDDSGSMNLNTMPDGLFSTPGTCETKSPTKQRYDELDFVKCASKGRRFMASSHLNKVYYNPATTYQVPPSPSGAYATPSYTSVRINGYSTSSTPATLNLSTGYRALFRWFEPSNTHYAISNSDSSFDAGDAFYFRFNNSSGCSTNPKQDSCYDLVQMSTQSAAQQENFAIWFSFYRTRLMASKAGISRAFDSQTDSIRVGYGAINISPVIRAGVGAFNPGQRTAFFSWLHGKTATSTTPLNRALNAAGTYFKTDDPWRTDPNVTSSAMLECRQNFTILMTDGYYTDSSSVGDQDSTDGTLITGPKGKSYTYKAGNPFKDGVSNSLADVAMKYWKEDLKTNLPNTVPYSGANPAFWQHMVTFGVGLGVEGSIKPASTAFDAINSSAAVTWGAINTNEGKIDDLLHAGVNSRGGFFSADDPTKFAEGLSATLNTIQERVGSASNIAATAINSLQTESNLYQARYIAGQWSGDLWSYAVNDINTPVWKASEKLPAPSSRKIFVGNGSTSARNFTWANLTTAEKTALANDANIVDYLRGDQSKEKLKGGVYRDRLSALGDFVNSSPELVGKPIDMSYHRYSWAGASAYRTFLNEPEVKSRAPMIYVGGNDGMVHGFNSSTGVEVFAFIPSAVMAPVSAGLSVLKKYSEPTYAHRFSVDGSPVVADVYIDDGWKSLLIGGMGRGGNSLYAIDVTNPETVSASSVLWDKSFAELGVYLGKPQVHRMESGNWAIVVGYGINNTSHKSGLLVIDVKTGNVLKKIPTTAGAVGDPNGMSEVNVLDIDNDGAIDWVYGGDLHGNVWKFDLSAASSSSWVVANSGLPLFQAKDASGNRQKITGGVMSSIDPKTGKSWVFFGTGQYLNQDDPSNTQTQTWYGIIDGPSVGSRSELAQRIMTNVGDVRVVTEADTLGVGKKGWYMDLIDPRERIVDLPVVVGSDLVMNTMIPDTNVCNPSGSGFVMAVSPYIGARLKRTFFDVNKDGVTGGSSDRVTVAGQEVEVSGKSTTSLNSVPTFSKKGDKIVALLNCENANVCEELVNLNKNVGLQSWHEVGN